MPNNIYRFRRIKWGEPKRLRGLPRADRPAALGWDSLAIVAGLLVLGALFIFLF